MPTLVIAVMACSCSVVADIDPVVYVRGGLSRGDSMIVVPKGVYEIEPEGPKETVYFRLSGLRDVTIDFSGSKLVGKVATRLFHIEGCTNLVLRNFTVDYAFLPFTQAVIEKVDVEQSWDVRVIDGYPVPEISYELGGGIQDHTDFWPIQAYDGQTLEWVNPMRFQDNVAIIRTGERTYRISGGKNRVGKVGDIAVWSIMQRDRPTEGECFYSRRCANCLFEDITVYSTPMGRAFIEYDAAGNVYRRCKVRRCPPEEDLVRRGLKRLRSGNHDGFISKNSYRGFTLDDCEATYHCDDCVNISGMYCLVSANRNGRLRVLGNWKDVVCEVGDAVQVMDRDGTTHEAVVKEWNEAGEADSEERMWLDDDKSSGLVFGLGKDVKKAFDVVLEPFLPLERGSVIISHNRMGDGFRIINCRFGHSRSRGLLLKASHGLVANCLIEDCAGSGIALTTEYPWLSGGCSSDVAVRGCTVRGNREWQVDVCGDCAARTPLATGAHKNILLENNYLEGGFGIALAGCADCTVTNNTYVISGTEKSMQPNAPVFDAPIFAVNCTNLVVDAPVTDRPASYVSRSMVPSVTPVPGNSDPNSTWMKEHLASVEKAKAGGAEVVFLGDSITRGWETSGVQVWRKYFLDPPYRALNLGGAGDRTEHVLWRIDHGELDGFKAKAVVLMIGSNNIGQRKDESTIDCLLGVWEIIGRVRAKQPTARIILTAILPRGKRADDPFRRRCDEVNRQLCTLANGRDIVWCDFNSSLLLADGTLPYSVMNDYLHPQNYGYEIWANAVLPMINDALDRRADRLAPSRYPAALDPSQAFDGPLAATPFMDRIGYKGAGSPQDWYIDKLRRDRMEVAESGGAFDVVFVGDSITHGWEGKPAFSKLRETYKILNLGYSGDGTQHVLWRLRNGQLDGYKTKLFMLMIGQNNGGDPSCVDGTKRIVALMKEKHPEAKVLLLPIFPYKPSADAPERKPRAEASARYKAEIVDNKTVFWHDFNARLLAPDGSYSKEIAPDYLHPGPKGYEIWANEVRPFFRRFCGK